jgi:hypothetical protein
LGWALEASGAGDKDIRSDMNKRKKIQKKKKKNVRSGLERFISFALKFEMTQLE